MHNPSTVQRGSVPAHFIGLSAHEKEQQKFAEARVRMLANSKQDVMRMWRAQPRAHDCTLGWPVVKGGK